MTQHRKPRAGISLLEIIVCTALVAVMIVPIAGVMRASSQSIAQAGQDGSTVARLRRGLSWLAGNIREGQILGVSKNGIKMTLPGGKDVKVVVDAGNLIMTDGGDPVILTEGVRSIRFNEFRQAAPPNSLIGLQLTLSATDPASGALVSANSLVSLPAQF